MSLRRHTLRKWETVLQSIRTIYRINIAIFQYGGSIWRHQPGLATLGCWRVIMVWPLKQPSAHTSYCRIDVPTSDLGKELALTTLKHHDTIDYQGLQVTLEIPQKRRRAHLRNLSATPSKWKEKQEAIRRFLSEITTTMALSSSCSPTRVNVMTIHGNF